MSTAASTGPEAVRLIEAARHLGPTIMGMRDEIERERKLPAPLFEQLRDLGFFSLLLPRPFGGLELSLMDYIKVVEAVSRLDGSVGWCVTIGGGAPAWLSGFLPEAVARRIFVEDRSLVAGTLGPIGRAVPVPGGFRMTGHWPFGSGIMHSAWTASGCVAMDGDAPRRKPDGAPDTRILFAPTTAVEIIDTWYAGGLRGTGSHDYRVADVFVPESHAIVLGQDPVVPGPLYVLPPHTVLGTTIAAVPLGIARAALDAVREMSAGKTPRIGAALLRDRPVVQAAIGRAEAQLRVARAFLFEACEEAWSAASNGTPVALEQRAAVRLALAQAGGLRRRSCRSPTTLAAAPRSTTVVPCSAASATCIRRRNTFRFKVWVSRPLAESCLAWSRARPFFDVKQIWTYCRIRKRQLHQRWIWKPPLIASGSTTSRRLNVAQRHDDTLWQGPKRLNLFTRPNVFGATYYDSLICYSCPLLPLFSSTHRRSIRDQSMLSEHRSLQPAVRSSSTPVRERLDPQGQGGVGLMKLAFSAFMGLAAASGAVQAQQQSSAPSDAQLISSAMSAAPKAVGEGATIVAMDANGNMRTLRQGSNGFTCMPDDPGSPGPDPMCLDANAMEWLHAWMAKAPPPNKVGLVYMLVTGSDASNTDAHATEPAAGRSWITTGPHVMVVGPAVRHLEAYPRTPDPDTARPYVMWYGTPYEHLMIPVR